MNRFFVILFAAYWLLTGCSQFEPFVEEENDCLISFNLRGEITSSDTPMTKVSGDDLYLVQIYRGTNPFAHGIFDNSDFHFNLKSGNDKYKIRVCLVKNGKTLLGTNYSAVNNSVNMKSNTSFDDYVHKWRPINNKYYNSVREYKFFESSSSTSLSFYDLDFGELKNITISKINDTKYPQCTDWFYGGIDNYSPTGESEVLNIDLKRVGFQLKYELSGVTDGQVTVKVYNDSRTFINNTTSSSSYSSEPCFFAFYEARQVWLYAEDYTENMTLAVSWKRGIGVTEDYGTKTIQIKRNCLNNIKINLGSNDQSAGMNLTVEAESTIGAENVTIPVE